MDKHGRNPLDLGDLLILDRIRFVPVNKDYLQMELRIELEEMSDDLLVKAASFAFVGDLKVRQRGSNKFSVMMTDEFRFGSYPEPIREGNYSGSQLIELLVFHAEDNLHLAHLANFVFDWREREERIVPHEGRFMRIKWDRI